MLFFILLISFSVNVFIGTGQILRIARYPFFSRKVIGFCFPVSSNIFFFAKNLTNASVSFVRPGVALSPKSFVFSFLLNSSIFIIRKIFLLTAHMGLINNY